MMELKDVVKWIADAMYHKRMGGSWDYGMHSEISMTAMIYKVDERHVRTLAKQYIKMKHGVSL